MRTLTLAVALLFPAAAAAQAPPDACRIRATGLNFGLYRSLDPFPTFARAEVDVDCGSSPVTVRVTLTPGYSGRLLDRGMVQSNYRLRYNIYADPAHRLIAGDGTGGSIALVPLLRRLGGRNRFLLFGEIPPRQAIPAGDYADQVDVVLEF